MPLDRLTRLPEYGSTDRADLDALLDEQVLATVTCVVEGRASSPPEYAATLALALPITPGIWVYKASLDGPDTPQGADGAGVWGGIVPLRTVAGEPQEADWSHAPVPASVERLLERYP